MARSPSGMVADSHARMQTLAERVSTGSNSSTSSAGATAVATVVTAPNNNNPVGGSKPPPLLKNSSFTKVEALLEQQTAALPGHALPPTQLPRDVTLACRKGIPPASRSSAYFYLSGGLHKQAANPPAAYQTLAASSASSVDDATLLAVESAVGSLYTSFVRAPQFLSASFQEALSRVVLALAAGGANKGHLEQPRALVHIAALLLMTMGKSNEERAFWTLCAMTEDRLFPTCHGEISLGSSVELRVLQQLVAKKLPRVAAHLQKLQADVTAIAGCWFTTLFTASLPLEVVLRIWDCTMREGSKAIIRVALALIKKYESAILSCMHVDMLRKVVESRVRCTNDAQELLDLAFKGIGSLKSSCLADMRCLACAELAKMPRPATVGWPCPLSLSLPV